MRERPLMERLHGPTAANVPRWAVISAYLVHLVVLPSCIWRIAGFTFGLPLVADRSSGNSGLFPDSWGPIYVIVLSLVTEGFAFLAFGLVCRWGEVVPRWVPRLRGRHIPIRAAVIPAMLGTLVLTIYSVALFVHIALGNFGTEKTGNGVNTYAHSWQTVVAGIAYVPLAAWAPLLGALTVHYYRRRRSATSSIMSPDRDAPPLRIAP